VFEVHADEVHVLMRQPGLRVLIDCLAVVGVDVIEMLILERFRLFLFEKPFGRFHDVLTRFIDAGIVLDGKEAELMRTFPPVEDMRIGFGVVPVDQRFTS
jgi:hypothetical protein